MHVNAQTGSRKYILSLLGSPDEAQKGEMFQ